MRKLDPASYRTMPWKNGGGTTTEVLTVPAGADLESFEARVSVARVEMDGPFSLFAGVDRTLVLTAGAGVTLRTADGAAVTLDPGSAPFGFIGDLAIHASLVAGPVADVGVMTRRSALLHRARRIALEGDRTVTCPGVLTVLLVLAGDLVATDGGAEIALTRGDVLTLGPGEPPAVVRVAPASDRPPADLLLVDFVRP
jgi:environmental stress-induced protein Ves